MFQISSLGSSTPGTKGTGKMSMIHFPYTPYRQNGTILPSIGDNSKTFQNFTIF